MPYHISDHQEADCAEGKPYAVVNSQTGKVVPGGCHAERADADRHMRALYANVEDASPTKGQRAWAEHAREVQDGHLD